MPTKIVSRLLMGAALIAWPAAFAGAAEEAAAASPTRSESAAQQAEIKSLKERVQASVRRLPKKGADLQPQHVRELVTLYGEVQANGVLSSQERLRLRLVARRGLMRAQKSLEQSLAAERRKSRASAANASARSGAGSASAGSHRSSAGESLFDGSSAGNGGAGGGAVEDNAQALIELIQSTISPESWDVAGGAGTIHYYRPLHVLVIRNTDEVHERIGGVASGLRK